MEAVYYYAKGVAWGLGMSVSFWAFLRYGLATKVGRVVFMLIYVATHGRMMVPHAGAGMYYEQLWFWLCLLIVFSTTLLLYVWRAV